LSFMVDRAGGRKRLAILRCTRLGDRSSNTSKAGRWISGRREG
jgi:hypothetical protein